MRVSTCPEGEPSIAQSLIFSVSMLHSIPDYCKRILLFIEIFSSETLLAFSVIAEVAVVYLD